ncbi:MAG: hypothetical protein Q4D82_05365, partial [Neisseria sp.]|nr:hypothetical protein [Neisseria sp.]
CRKPPRFTGCVQPNKYPSRKSAKRPSEKCYFGNTAFFRRPFSQSTPLGYPPQFIIRFKTPYSAPFTNNIFQTALRF